MVDYWRCCALGRAIARKTSNRVAYRPTDTRPKCFPIYKYGGKGPRNQAAENIFLGLRRSRSDGQFFGVRRRRLLQCSGKADSARAKGIHEILNSFLSDHTTLHSLIPGLAEDFGLPARLDIDNIVPTRRSTNKLDIEVYL